MKSPNRKESDEKAMHISNKTGIRSAKFPWTQSVTSSHRTGWSRDMSGAAI